MRFPYTFHKLSPAISHTCRCTFFSGKNPGNKKGGPSKKYSNTLNLPKTEFPISLKDAAVREKDIQSVSML